MKKLILLSAVLLGAASAARAGVSFNIGIGFPIAPPVVACPAPVYTAPAPVYVAPPPVVYSPPVVYRPPVVCAPAPSIYLGFGAGCYGPRYGWGHYRGWGHGGEHHGWHH